MSYSPRSWEFLCKWQCPQTKITPSRNHAVVDPLSRLRGRQHSDCDDRGACHGGWAANSTGRAFNLQIYNAMVEKMYLIQWNELFTLTK